MREIVLDTETTGFEPEAGDRIVEIGAVELIGHLPTGRTYHQYVNPQRAMSEGAYEVHGLGEEFLAGHPVFADIGPAFLDFIGDAPLIIHNAAFDMKFLNAELRWMGAAQLAPGRAVDTLAMARRRYPGAPASLDALCRRFGIDTSTRTLHGALLDAGLLAEVYLELVGGRQPNFGLGPQAEDPLASRQGWRAAPRQRALPPRVTSAEAAAHAALVASLPDAVWRRG